MPLPNSLTTAELSLDNILKVCESLTYSQSTYALWKYLKEGNGKEKEKQQASYILARLLQKSNDSGDQQQALALFEESEKLGPLGELSRWHKAEVAATLGKEKLVRENLNFFVDSKDSEKRAKAFYGLAQSYLRANEKERAQKAFSDLRSDYAQTAFAIGSLYYLGEIAWGDGIQQATNKTQSDQSSTAKASSDQTPKDEGAGPDSKVQNDSGSTTDSAISKLLQPKLTIHDQKTFKQAIAYFSEYLLRSPNGHFAAVAQERLERALEQNDKALTSENIDALANSLYMGAHFADSLKYFKLIAGDRRLVEIASATAHARKPGDDSLKNAEALLIKAVASPANHFKYPPVAAYICRTLSQDEAAKFWQSLLAAVSGPKDVALYNVGIRTAAPKSLQYFSELVSKYPASDYAADSAWWVVWDGIQHRSGKDLVPLITYAEAQSLRHEKSRAAPRLLFWCGKMEERVGSPLKAVEYYKKVLSAHPRDYYAFRAASRIAQIAKKSERISFNRKSNLSIPANWEPPQPQIFEKQKESILGSTALELLHLKQYDEALEIISDDDLEVKAWILANANLHVRSIAVASMHIRGHQDDFPMWQYAYPLYYTSQIQDDCRQFPSVDPYLMHALVREESHYDANALSASKALGLTQVMPGTAYGVAKLLNIPLHSTDDILNPVTNLKLGTEYLSYVLKQFNGNALYAVASYNGGAGAVKTWMGRQARTGKDDPDAFVESIPYRETRDYVRKVFGSYWNYTRIYSRQ